MFKAVGAVPVVIDLAELYIAQSQVTVIGYESPFIVVSTKLVEVTKYVSVPFRPTELQSSRIMCP